jgi:hypothetical protein
MPKIAPNGIMWRSIIVSGPLFSEDVVLGGLKAGPSWFVSDNLLRGDAGSGSPDDGQGSLQATIHHSELE